MSGKKQASEMTLTITGSPAEITRLLGSLDLGSRSAVGSEPIVPTRCRAVKKNGVRCKLTSQRTVMVEGFCPYHRHWTESGREVLPGP